MKTSTADLSNPAIAEEDPDTFTNFVYDDLEPKVYGLAHCGNVMSVAINSISTDSLFRSIWGAKHRRGF